MKVLVLGDCATNCNNCLAHKIYNNTDLEIERSLWYHVVSKRDIIKKFLKNKPESLHVYDLEYYATQAYMKEVEQIKNNYDVKYKNYNEKTFINWFLKETKRQPSEHNQDLLLAKQYLYQQELNKSWPNLLPFDVTNLSIASNHYGNYIIQIIDYIEKFGKPDCVLLCDMYTPQRHQGRWIHFKYKNKRHSYILFDRYLKKTYASDLPYSKKVFELKQKHYKKQKNFTQNSIDRRAIRYCKLLENFLNKNSIKYRFVLSRHDERKFFSHNEYIDITSFTNQWYVKNDNEIYSIENSSRKLETQQKIAQYVTDCIRN